jgi:micrococcal nuclease
VGRRRRASVTAVVVGLALTVVVAGCGGSDGPASGASVGAATPGGSGTSLKANATVTRVVDGDTIVADVDGTDERVRLIGIDTPESVKPNTPVKCFGKEASKHTAELLPEGTPVRLVLDVEERDRYDRLLAYVYRAADGDFVNLTIAREGYAQQATFPPNVAHVDEFRTAVADARGAGRGLWSACRDDNPFAR